MDQEAVAEHLLDRGIDAALVGLEEGHTDAIVAEMLKQGWYVASEEVFGGARIRILRAPEYRPVAAINDPEVDGVVQ